jgi:ABC-2 type transport system permease protein
VSALAGAGTLTGFALRRERVRIPVYLVLLVWLIATTALQSEGLYATQAERDDYAATVAGNPGLIALVGPALRVDTVGGDVAWQWGGLGAVIAALMSAFIVGRHTRAEEQSGRSELTSPGSTPRSRRRSSWSSPPTSCSPCSSRSR